MVNRWTVKWVYGWKMVGRNGAVDQNMCIDQIFLSLHTVAMHQYWQTEKFKQMINAFCHVIPNTKHWLLAWNISPWTVWCGPTWLPSWWTAPLAPAAPAQGSSPRFAVEPPPPSCRRGRNKLFFYGFLVTLHRGFIAFKHRHRLKSSKQAANMPHMPHMCGSCDSTVFRFRRQIIPLGNATKEESSQTPQ